MSIPNVEQPQRGEALHEFIASYHPEVQELVLALRALVLRVLPSAIEQVDPPSKIIAYGTDRTYAGLICAIAPFKAHVNLMFARGAELGSRSSARGHGQTGAPREGHSTRGG